MRAPLSADPDNDSGADGSSWVTDSFAITVADRSSPVGLTMRDLLGLALRRNPNRAQLLVSTVLGKHLAADPRVIVGVGRLVVEQLSYQHG